MGSSILFGMFGMMLRPGWDSNIFGPYFVLGALFPGMGVLITTMWVCQDVQIAKLLSG